MKKILILGLFIFLGTATWRIGARLSPDAIGMAIGVLFGILAGVPTALLLLAANRRKEEDDTNYGRQGRQPAMPYPAYPQQPPVIVLAASPTPGPLPAQYGSTSAGQPRYALPPPPETIETRQFRVVGEKEEWLDEY